MPVATIVSPEPRDADAGFQDIGLESSRPPTAAVPELATAPPGAEAIEVEASSRDDILDDALKEADEMLGPPPVDAPPVPGAAEPANQVQTNDGLHLATCGAHTPLRPRQAGGDLDSEFQELMKTPEK